MPVGGRAVIRVVGLDVSLTSTGIARLTVGDGSPRSFATAAGRRLAEGASLSVRACRIEDVRDDVLDEVAPGYRDGGAVWPDLVVLEGRSYGSNKPGADELAGLRWALLVALAGVPVVEVAPKTLKLYAVGDGNAPKTQVVQAVARHYGDLFTLPLRKADGQEDVADAAVLAAMGARAVGHPVDLDHPTRLRAMRSPKWPNPIRKD